MTCSPIAGDRRTRYPRPRSIRNPCRRHWLQQLLAPSRRRLRPLGRPDAYCLPAIVDFLEYDPRPEPESVGQALKRHRKGQGMSQKAFAIQLRVDQGTLARWERGERVPTGKFLDRVNRVLR
jgi:hypothetical protein